METNRDELFEVYDEAGNRLGLRPRRECHGNPALIHRTAHVVVFSQDGRLLLQKRSAHKDIQPGKWDTAVGGHLAPGETWEQAARRELEEELGISATGLALEFLFTAKIRNQIESEDIGVFALRHDGPFQPPADEIDELRFWSAAELRGACGHDLFTPNLEAELELLRPHFPLTPEERERYARHLRLPDVGESGQMRLKRSRVLVIGCGGLGSPALLYLAAAGVGTLGLVDSDRVDASNLQRQLLFGTADIGLGKAGQAALRLTELNPLLEYCVHPVRATAETIDQLLDGYEFVLDATDNFAAKFLINDACVRRGIPFVHGGILAGRGQCLSVLPGRSPCYRCVFGAAPPERPSDHTPAGPLGAVAGVIGTLQAMEAIKFLLGQGDLLTGRLLTYDAMGTQFRELRVPIDPACAACGVRAASSRNS